ncbi:MAG: sugar ABC transporter ATP-binding protein [Pseudomonadota bacterium]
MREEPLVDLRDIKKSFSGTPVLRGVSLSFRRAEVHGLLGGNGAGKSTLIKILTGVYSLTAGQIYLEGQPVKIGSPEDAHLHGLGAVYQDAELCNGFTVGENVVLGNEPRGLLLSQRAIHQEAQSIFDEIGITIDVRRPASSLSAAEMQLVTLATLFHRRYKLIVLDEPTARLSANEVDLLFKLIHRFKAEGITIVYISHRLGEIKQICERITILKGGLVAATLNHEEITEERVTELMVDRTKKDLETVNLGHATDRPCLAVDGLAAHHLAPLSFTVHHGEVLGITGPVGGGMEQIERALGGIVQHSGKISIDGKQVKIASPADARKAGIALIPEDRRKQALFPNLSIATNVCLPVLDSLSRLGLIRESLQMGYADSVMSRLKVHPHQPDKPVKLFSGGNQQKAVIGKWLKAEAKVFIFVEPTSGVDVGAIKEIYDIILTAAKEGAAVIVISSSVDEILSLSERVLVVHDGLVVHRGPTRECSEDQLISLSLGGRSREAAE